ncbi:MAG: TlpA disulfide reductase family protein [Marmoricola sp.]
MRRLLRALLLATAGLLLLTGCGSSGGGAGGFIAGDGLITWLPVAQRHEVGQVAGTLLSGARFDLASLRGKVVVVNVWGSWCAPCRAEAAKLAAADVKLRTSGVAFVGINTRDASPDNGIAFERAFGISYPSLYDPDGRTLLAFDGRITPNAIPSTIVLDKQGRIAASIIGELTSAVTLEDLVQDVINGKTAA